nr:type II toxin-antitoxin system PemK/MazF family toxin [Myceligenerans sp. TRM 65318]
MTSSGNVRFVTFSADNPYPGDFEGEVHPVYNPELDGEPDPGEVVWTWVPYEEDHTQGKDRPVLLVGKDGPYLLGLQLSSRDHDHDALQEAREGRIWMDIGTGRWDRDGRDSEVRINRVIRIDPDDVRREGDILDEAIFAEVVKYMDRALELT